MPTITDTTRSEALGIKAGRHYIRLKGTWGGGSVGIYYNEQETPAQDSDWDLLSDADGTTAFTDNKVFVADLPSGYVSFMAASAPTSVTAGVVPIDPRQIS